jgi:probable O-glycosylation ligase (exosortase A-associated)
MSITAIVFALIYFTGLILNFYNPVYGMITYIFEWHNHPPYYWWGDELPDLRWSYTIAIATLVSYVINKNRLQRLYAKPDYSLVIWIVLLILNMALVSYSVALFPDASYDKTMDVVKKLVLVLLMIGLIRNKRDYNILIWVIMLCVANMGFIALDGSNRDIGVIAPNATEENALSAHVMAMLPFFGVYFLIGNKWQKLILALSVPLCLNLIILANSRATVLGLIAIGVLAIFLIKGKYRIVVIVGLVLGAFVFLQLTNEQFFERQDTNYSDRSSQSRIWIWKGALDMWKDHPFGVGDHGFEELSMSYIAEIDEPKSQHNTFVAILTDWGIIALVLYLVLLIHTFIITMQVKRWSKNRPEFRWYALNTTAIQLALVGITAAGMFHSRQYSEVVYWLMAMAVVQKNLLRDEIAQQLLQADEEETEKVVAATSGENGMSIVQRQR